MTISLEQIEHWSRFLATGRKPTDESKYGLNSS